MPALASFSLVVNFSFYDFGSSDRLDQHLRHFLTGRDIIYFFPQIDHSNSNFSTEAGVIYSAQDMHSVFSNAAFVPDQTGKTGRNSHLYARTDDIPFSGRNAVIVGGVKIITDIVGVSAGGEFGGLGEALHFKIFSRGLVYDFYWDGNARPRWDRCFVFAYLFI